MAYYHTIEAPHTTTPPSTSDSEADDVYDRLGQLRQNIPENVYGLKSGTVLSGRTTGDGDYSVAVEIVQLNTGTETPVDPYSHTIEAPHTTTPPSTSDSEADDDYNRLGQLREIIPDNVYGLESGTVLSGGTAGDGEYSAAVEIVQLSTGTGRTTGDGEYSVADENRRSPGTAGRRGFPYWWVGAIGSAIVVLVVILVLVLTLTIRGGGANAEGPNKSTECPIVSRDGSGSTTYVVSRTTGSADARLDLSNMRTKVTDASFCTIPVDPGLDTQGSTSTSTTMTSVECTGNVGPAGPSRDVIMDDHRGHRYSILRQSSDLHFRFAKLVYPGSGEETLTFIDISSSSDVPLKCTRRLNGDAVMASTKLAETSLPKENPKVPEFMIRRLLPPSAAVDKVGNADGKDWCSDESVSNSSVSCVRKVNNFRKTNPAATLENEVNRELGYVNMVPAIATRGVGKVVYFEIWLVIWIHCSHSLPTPHNSTAPTLEKESYAKLSYRSCIRSTSAMAIPTDVSVMIVPVSSDNGQFNRVCKNYGVDCNNSQLTLFVLAKYGDPNRKAREIFANHFLRSGRRAAFRG